MTRIVVVRHGNTFAPGEPARRIGARTDIPLVDSGRRQARDLGDWFARRAMFFDIVLSSPSLRCLETACLIAPDRPAVRTDWLMEIDHGPDEGAPEEQVVERLGTAALQRWDDKAEPPDGWIVDRDSRIEAWRGLFRDASATTLAVTSNGASRFALIAAGLQREAGMKLRTGAVGEFTTDGGTAALICWDVRPEDAAPLFLREG